MISKTAPQVKKRPHGITMIALYNCISGIYIIFPVILLALMKVLGDNVSFNNIPVTLLGFVNILLFWGLWKKKPWAIWSTISVQVVALFYIWFWGPQSISPDGNGKIVYSIIPIIILVYLSFI